MYTAEPGAIPTPANETAGAGVPPPITPTPGETPTAAPATDEVTVGGNSFRTNEPVGLRGTIKKVTGLFGSSDQPTVAGAPDTSIPAAVPTPAATAEPPSDPWVVQPEVPAGPPAAPQLPADPFPPGEPVLPPTPDIPLAPPLIADAFAGAESALPSSPAVPVAPPPPEDPFAPKITTEPPASSTDQPTPETPTISGAEPLAAPEPTAGPEKKTGPLSPEELEQYRELNGRLLDQLASDGGIGDSNKGNPSSSLT